MPFTITMPKLSPTMESGTIVKWHKKEGDRVEAGDVLLEISTDKATVEHTALDEGFLRQILVKEGKEVPINHPIAILTEKLDESIEDYKPEEVSNVKTEEAKVQENPAPPEKAAAASHEQRIIASPLAKKLASQQGIDLSQIEGSGPRGRVVAKDLQQAQNKSPSSPPGTIQEIPLNAFRKVISQRLQEAKNSIPHFYLEQTINAEA